MGVEWDPYVGGPGVFYDDSLEPEPDFTCQNMQKQRQAILEGRCQVCWRLLAWPERNLVISSKPLEVSSFEVDGLRMAYVFYESGLSINVMYSLEEGGKRAVGFKLSDGMEVPEELASASSSPGKNPSSPAPSAAPTL